MQFPLTLKEVRHRLERALARRQAQTLAQLQSTLLS